VDDRLTRLESTVEQLQSELLALRRRLDSIENPGVASTTPDAIAAATEAVGVARGEAPAAPAATRPVVATKSWRDPVFVMSLVGRLLIVLGGAFFLRAMTDTGALAPPVGVGLGFAYGLVWLVMTYIAGGRGQRPSAVFHSIAAAMVAFPLVAEAATNPKFHVLSGEASALAVTVLTTGLLFVAWRRRLYAVAWVTVLVAIPTSIGLFAKTGVVVPFAFYFIALGIATLWMGYALDWLALRWPVALVADMVVLGVMMRALAPDHPESPGVAMLVQLSLLTAYVGSIAIRTLVRGRNVIPFEVVQTIAALVIGFGGAVQVTRATGALPTMLGVSSLVFGVACYGVAFAFIDRSEDRGRNVYFYTTLALVLVLVGCDLVLAEHWLGVVFAVLAVAASGLWTRVGRLFMLLHAAAYILAAGMVTGALSYCVWALAAGGLTAWTLPATLTVFVMGAAAVSAALAAVAPASDGSAYASGPRFVIVLVLVMTAGGCLVGYAAPLVGGLPNQAIDLGIVATLRTAVLALATLLVAWIGQKPRFREWGWLVYPLLVGIGLKMVAQDFQSSRPATLFIALALYGTALIVAPRLRR
jgi:hypothetical protein